MRTIFICIIYQNCRELNNRKIKLIRLKENIVARKLIKKENKMSE